MTAAKPKSVRGVTVEGLRPFIDWLDSEQDPEAYVSQFGVGKDIGDFYCYIAAHGPFNEEARLGGSVMVFTIAEKKAKYVEKEKGWHRELTNGITPRTRNALQRLIEEIVPVHSSWNGVGKACDTCSFHIAKDAGPDVERAYQNYHKKPMVQGLDKRPFVKGLEE